MYKNLPLRKILWLSELVGLSRQRYLSSVVSSSAASASLWHLPWATRRMTHVPQTHSDVQSRYARSHPSLCFYNIPERYSEGKSSNRAKQEQERGLGVQHASLACGQTGRVKKASQITCPLPQQHSA